MALKKRLLKFLNPSVAEDGTEFALVSEYAGVVPPGTAMLTTFLVLAPVVYLCTDMLNLSLFSQLNSYFLLLFLFAFLFLFFHSANYHLLKKLYYYEILMHLK